MPLPNFVVIGAAKAGTTSLYHYLNQHPQVYMGSRKEPNFFAFGEAPLPEWQGPSFDLLRKYIVMTMDDYLMLFADVKNELAIGEASVTNFQPRACERIQHYLPNAKLIAIIRQPADRIYSFYSFLLSRGHEPLNSFAKALKMEKTGHRDHWMPWLRYVEEGFYYTRIKNFYNHFPREQIRIYLYDDWQREPLTILRDIFRFIGVDDHFIPNTSVRHNISRLPRSPRLLRFLRNPNHPLKNALKPLVPFPIRQRLVRTLRTVNLTKPPPLDPHLRRQLTERYRDDIRRLETLIERDLSAWLA